MLNARVGLRSTSKTLFLGTKTSSIKESKLIDKLTMYSLGTKKKHTQKERFHKKLQIIFRRLLKTSSLAKHYLKL
jgi:hypothetical protein